MRRTQLLVLLLALTIATTTVTAAWGQQRGQRRNQNRNTQRDQQKDNSQDNEEEEEEEPPAPLPTDPRLLDIHRDFVRKAERLATEYENAGEYDKARDVYIEVLRLVPTYTPGVEKMNKLREQLATAERVVVDVFADRDWQDSGISLIQGKPVRIQARGEWTFKMTYKLPADGVEIPEKLRDFNLGALVGVIDPSNPEEIDEDNEEAIEPFLIGSKFEFDAPISGRLMLRMYDSDTKDNAGKLSVEIKGTFKQR